MNSSARKCYTVFMFSCLVIILLISTCEPMGVFYPRCRKISQIWKEKHCGFAISHTLECNSTCINMDHAMFGACEHNLRSPFFPMRCYCTFKCSEFTPPEEQVWSWRLW
ncbi:unnamed protein product [Trifolium pratense]|uniref:Uncharacterized protein n=1 Tax=Trifolium pratense TaxID=57577 RepID=A0ACB0IT77_TRIPR|nr:unnamed protein product [Trifolium pratense]